jgi:predicted Ser/Thr protein kinase
MGGLELEVAGEFDAFAMAFLMVARQVKNTSSYRIASLEKLKQKHAIAIAEKAVFLLDRMGISG